MATIGDLVVNLGMDTSSLVSGAVSGRQALSAFVGASTTSLTAFAAATASTVSTAGEILGTLGQVVGAASGQVIAPMAEKLKAALTPVAAPIIEAFTAVGQQIRDQFAGPVEPVKQAWQSGAAAVGGAWEGVAGKLSATWSGIASPVAESFRAVGGDVLTMLAPVTQAWTNVSGVISSAWSTSIAPIRENWEKLSASVGITGQKWAAAVQTIGPLFTTAAGVAEAAWVASTEKIGKAWGAMASGAASSAMSFASGALTGGIGAVVGILGSAAAAAWSFGSGLFDSAQGLAAVNDTPAPFAEIQQHLGMLSRSLAGILTPSIQEFNMLLYDIADLVMSMLGPAVDQTSAICEDWGQTLRGWVSTGLDMVYDGIIAGVFALQHWREIGMLAGMQVALSFVQLGATVVHFFTGTLPALFSWFSKNWFDIFTTAADFVGSVFKNIGVNIANAMKAIWKFISSGGTAELELAWTPLLTGFENTISELPDLPERVAGDLEKTLTAERDRLAGIVGTGMTEAIANAPGRRRNLPKPPAAPEGTPDGLKGDGGGGSRQEQNAALMRGSAEAVNALVAAANGEQNSAAERNAKAAEEALAEQMRANDLLRDIKDEIGKDSSQFSTVEY